MVSKQAARCGGPRRRLRFERLELRRMLAGTFQDNSVMTGLNQPSVVRFSPDERVFIAEKTGIIKVFDNLEDTTPTVFADLRTNVYNSGDRGMLGMALHPSFPETPYVYVLYAHDAEIGGTAPRWGTAGANSDPCPDPPGSRADGCVISGRLSRLRADGDVMVGDEEVLVEDWGQQYSSHSIGHLEFGADGALYASAGDGASFTFADYGQEGDPPNPLGDAPLPVGGIQTAPTAEGGALRSQDLRTPDDPVSLDGSIIRVDPLGAPLPDNPLIDHADANAQRIVSYGLRNPYRFAVRPGTRELWIGDVGWGTWEEINRVVDPSDAVVDNFGWPAYEGPNRQPRYDAENLDLIEDLYNDPDAHTTPYYAYRHNEKVDPDSVEPTGTSAISGVAFHEGEGSYPAEYEDALFFADFSRDHLWVMFAGEDGLPDPDTRRSFIGSVNNPVYLTIGPSGNLYYLDIVAGAIREISYVNVATVEARALLYNNSAFDGRDPQVSSADDAALATDKMPLRPGETATLANYTSYPRGINALVVDIADLASVPTLPELGGYFDFHVGNNDLIGSWDAAPQPIEVVVRPGAGVAGTDRVTILWEDNAIQNQWLQVTVLANELTGLQAPDVFYFGNAIGDSGDSVSDAHVNAQDIAAARDNPRNFLDPADVSDRFDFDRDRFVNAQDVAIARDHPTNFLTALKLITPPSGTIVMEAESFTRRVAHTDGWEYLVVPAESAGAGGLFDNFRGEGYLQSLPDNGINFQLTNPRGEIDGGYVEYVMSIGLPGEYQLYPRWDGFDGGSDSIFASVVELTDGEGGAIADWYLFTGQSDTDFATTPWDANAGFEQSAAGVSNPGPAVWAIDTPGQYTLRIWIREDGAALDAFVFQLSHLPPPTGDGPAVTNGVAAPARLPAAPVVPLRASQPREADDSFRDACRAAFFCSLDDMPWQRRPDWVPPATGPRTSAPPAAAHDEALGMVWDDLLLSDDWASEEHGQAGAGLRTLGVSEA